MNCKKGFLSCELFSFLDRDSSRLVPELNNLICPKYYSLLYSQ